MEHFIAPLTLFQYYSKAALKFNTAAMVAMPIEEKALFFQAAKVFAEKAEIELAKHLRTIEGQS